MASATRPLPDTVLITYGLLAGGARVVLPPVWDLPLLRTIRGAMFDRVARAAGVTLTAEARRLLVDLDEPASSRGILEQGVRWAAGRFLPGAAVADGVRNVLRTYAAGAIFQRYIGEHRPEPRDSVLNSAEAARIHRAMRVSVNVLSLEHLRAVTRVAMASFQTAGSTSKEVSLVQRYSDAVVATLAELPVAWIDVMDGEFVRELGPAPGKVEAMGS